MALPVIFNKNVYFRIFVRLRQRHLGSGKHLHFAQLVLFPFQNPRLQNGGELVNPASGHTVLTSSSFQVQIPVSEVLNITRERTALFIPNAIGVLTKQDKVRTCPNFCPLCCLSPRTGTRYDVYSACRILRGQKLCTLT